MNLVSAKRSSRFRDLQERFQNPYTKGTTIWMPGWPKKSQFAGFYANRSIQKSPS